MENDYKNQPTEIITINVIFQGWTKTHNPSPIVKTDHVDYEGQMIFINGLSKRKLKYLEDGKWHEIRISKPCPSIYTNFLSAEIKDGRKLYLPYLPKLKNFEQIQIFNDYLEENKFFGQDWEKSKVLSLLKVEIFRLNIIEKLLIENEKMDQTAMQHLKSCEDLIYLKEKGEVLSLEEEFHIKDIHLFREFGLICTKNCNESIHLANKCRFENRMMEWLKEEIPNKSAIKTNLTNFQPTFEQQKFIHWFSWNKRKIISLLGVGGSGKTFTLGKILNTSKVLALAPTHKAKNNLRQNGFIHVETLQKIAMNKNDFFEDESQKYDFVLVDEISMATIEMVYDLINIFHVTQRFIFIGDECQLPPVSLDKDALTVCGNVISLIRQVSGRAGVFEFKENHRCKNNQVNEYIQAVREVNQSFLFQNTIKHTESFPEMVAYKEKHIDISECMIVCHTNKTVAEINELFYLKLSQNTLNKVPFYRKLNGSDEGFGGFFEGAQVVFYENDSTYYHGYTNSEFGIIEKLSLPIGEKGGQVTVKTEEGTSYHIPLNQAKEDLKLSYAITIHKSQGSGAGKVYILEPKNHGLAYTAVSRSKGQLAFVDLNVQNLIRDLQIQAPVKKNINDKKKTRPFMKKGNRRRSMPRKEYLSFEEEIKEILEQEYGANL